MFNNFSRTSITSIFRAYIRDGNKEIKNKIANFKRIHLTPQFLQNPFFGGTVATLSKTRLGIRPLAEFRLSTLGTARKTLTLYNLHANISSQCDVIAGQSREKKGDTYKTWQHKTTVLGGLQALPRHVCEDATAQKAVVLPSPEVLPTVNTAFYLPLPSASSILPQQLETLPRNLLC